MASEADERWVLVGECTDSYGDPIKVYACDGEVMVDFYPDDEDHAASMQFRPPARIAFAELLDRAAMPGQVPPGRFRDCCVHCEHNGESDPDLDAERHPNLCPHGCPPRILPS